MVSVQGYINKSKEAAVKANMSKLQTSATEYYLSNGNYDNICANSGGFETIKDAVVKITNQDEGVTPFCIDYPTEPTCENKWLALGKINDSGDIYCVDSFGQMGMTDISITGCMCNLVSDDPSTCFPECPWHEICSDGACIDDPGTCFPECNLCQECIGGFCYNKCQMSQCDLRFGCIPKH